MRTTTNMIRPAIAAFALAGFALLPKAEAVSPPPDGGYPGGNTAEGQAALLSRTTGGFNTAVGYLSLRGDSTGSFNTAIGAGALFANTADQETATGAGALLSNTTGLFNTANGAFALFSNTTGFDNTAIGDDSLFTNTIGDDNTAVGTAALFGNTSGSDNIAIGRQTLSSNTTGGGNVALGDFAGVSVTTASNVICIGHNVQGDNVSNTSWIGNVFGVTTQNGMTVPVIVSADGQLGTVASSERFKKDIATMEKSSEAILSFRPVTFHYKSDGKGTPQFGLIAEEVAKVNPALVLPDKEGKPYTVRYDAVNAMLLNEFLKEHRKVEEQTSRLDRQTRRIQQQEATIAQLKREVESVVAHSKEQDSQIQKVRNQMEMKNPEVRVVASNH